MSGPGSRVLRGLLRAFTCALRQSRSCPVMHWTRVALARERWPTRTSAPRAGPVALRPELGAPGKRVHAPAIAWRTQPGQVLNLIDSQRSEPTIRGAASLAILLEPGPSAENRLRAGVHPAELCRSAGRDRCGRSSQRGHLAVGPAGLRRSRGHLTGIGGIVLRADPCDPLAAGYEPGQVECLVSCY